MCGSRLTVTTMGVIGNAVHVIMKTQLNGYYIAYILVYMIDQLDSFFYNFITMHIANS